MRLIDLDKALAKAEDECRMSDDWKVAHEMMNVFKYQPTVNAIPIEWFKKKIDWHLDNVIYGAEVYQWVLNRWYEDKENWEKENEID